MIALRNSSRLLTLLSFGTALIGSIAFAGELFPLREIESPVSSFARQVRAKPRIHLAFVSHNEQPSNAGCAPLYEWTTAGRAKLAKNRDFTIRLAGLLALRGARYHLQTDYSYIDALSRLEAYSSSVTASTSGLSLFPYLEATYPSIMSIDPHHHETATTNIADVHSRITVDLGLPATAIVGGYLASPSSDADWEQYRSAITPISADSSHTFEAEILWGGASKNHTCDPTASGVWRPKSASEYFTHDSAASLTNIGNGPRPKFLKYLSADSSDLESRPGIESLLHALDSGLLDRKKIYTAALFIDQCTLSESVLTQIDDYLSTWIDPRVSSGDVVWSSLSETFRRWKTVYGEAANIYDPAVCP